MNVSYTQLNSELAKKIKEQKLTDKDKTLINEIIMQDYEYYMLWSRVCKIVYPLFLLNFFLMFYTMMRASQGASSLPLQAVLISLAVLFIATLVSGLKVNKVIHIKEALALMKKYYPQEFEQYGGVK